MCDIRIRQFQAFDQWKDSNPVGNHIHWNPLCHALPTMDNIAFPIHASQDKRIMMMISVKNKWAPDGHKWKNFHNILIVLILLNTSFVLTSENPNFPWYIKHPKEIWTPCAFPLINAFNPAQIWYSLYTWIDSGTLTFSTHLGKSQRQVYPSPTRRTPGILSNAIRRPDTNAQ